MFEEAQHWTREKIKAAETACINNENDPNAWRHWAETLLEMAGVMEDENYGANEILDAITKLEKCLELNPDDPDEVKWTIGEAYMKLLLTNGLIMPDDEYEKCCKGAVACFNEVRALKPDYEKDSTSPEIAQQGLEYLISLSAPMPAWQLKLLNEEKATKQACKENPDDVENWKKWVTSVEQAMGLIDGEDLDKEMLSDAKNKLEAAMKEDNKDLELMWSLGEVYMLIVSADPSIRYTKYIYRKYCDKAMPYFNAVRFVDNDYRRGSIGIIIARNGRRI